MSEEGRPIRLSEEQMSVRICLWKEIKTTFSLAISLSLASSSLLSLFSCEISSFFSCPSSSPDFSSSFSSFSFLSSFSGDPVLATSGLIEEVLIVRITRAVRGKAEEEKAFNRIGSRIREEGRKRWRGARETRR
jgi:hypothetical protein